MRAILNYIYIYIHFHLSLAYPSGYYECVIWAPEDKMLNNTKLKALYSQLDE